MSTTTTALPTLNFPSGIPGFPGRHEFMLEGLDPLGALFDLHCPDDPSVRLLLVPPGVFFPDYLPELDQSSIDLLGLVDGDEAQILVVLTTGATAAQATANLLAPIVVNIRTGAAAQVILSGSGLPIRAPIAR